MDQFLRQASNAVANGKLSSFEKIMQSKGVSLLEQCAYLTDNEREPYWKPFATVLKLGVDLMKE